MAWTSRLGQEERQGQFMDVARAISELHSQLEHIQQAIRSLERLDRSNIGTAETAARFSKELRAVKGARAGSKCGRLAVCR